MSKLTSWLARAWAVIRKIAAWITTYGEKP